ncbi:unnamed protein product [Nesidiocoris tenuis]|uniref:Uncharacterized protein n=1 Tax=Nesidiocoris tenuis TaxID=355587 RepID=A0A6H5HU17_9HEMI|nr:unnamed protein product [Nesidiocoris tenuis]
MTDGPGGLLRVFSRQADLQHNLLLDPGQESGRRNDWISSRVRGFRSGKNVRRFRLLRARTGFITSLRKSLMKNISPLENTGRV